MTFFESYHLPHYFAAKLRKEIEHLYASVAIGNLAQAIITIFEPIFLYNVVGLTVTQILMFMGAVYALYALIIPWGGRVATRYGYSHSIMISIPFQAVYWFLLLGSEHHTSYLVLAALAFAMQKTFYWPALHASLSRFAKKSQRGREFSLMYAIMNLMQIIGPMIGGFLSATIGIESIFIVVSLIYFCSIVPLLMSSDKLTTAEKYDYKDTIALYKQYPLRFLGYFGFGEELLVLTIWPIFIFIIVTNYQDTGALVTVATLVATGLALYIGFYTDKHSKQALLRSGTLIYALTWLARVPIVAPFAVFITDTLSRTAKSLVFIPVSALTYERADKTKIMPFVIGFEQSLAIGKFLACLFGMLIFATTGSFAALFIGGAIFSLFYFLI